MKPRILNQGAWSTMENEWARWTAQGYEVHYRIDVYPAGAVRPDRFQINYSVVQPSTGEILFDTPVFFDNQPGQTYVRRTLGD